MSNSVNQQQGASDSTIHLGLAEGTMRDAMTMGMGMPPHPLSHITTVEAAEALGYKELKVSASTVDELLSMPIRGVTTPLPESVGDSGTCETGKGVRAMKRKLLAVILAWFFWWIPLGLHRIVMRQKYWWVHTLLAVTASAASFRFYHNAYNLKLGRGYMETGIVPPLGTYANTWLLVFAALWLIVVLYDLIAVLFWPSPDRSASHD